MEFLAPRPGLEPGTYGLTVRANKYSLPLIDVATIDINQQLTPHFKGLSVDSYSPKWGKSGYMVATWAGIWLHGGYMKTGQNDGKTKENRRARPKRSS